MEKQPKRDKDKGDQAEAGFEQDLYEAMRLEGWVLPETDEEVAEVESCSEAPPLPDELVDAYAVLRRAQHHRKPAALVNASNTEIEENLARAAREGGDISPEVENVMEADREAAERKKHGNES